MKKVHIVHDYLFNQNHGITIGLIGCGGTGSNVLQNLVALDKALRATGKQGINVFVYDHDEVTEANAARQLFYPSDIGQNKANVLVSRINRSYGLSWTAVPTKYDGLQSFNITISCVDTIQARLVIDNMITKAHLAQTTDVRMPYYWMDIGNSKASGQIILGTVVAPKAKSKKYDIVNELPSVVGIINLLEDSADDGPSCSLAQALQRQDLYINKMMATLATDMLWKMFNEAAIEFRGIYANLETFNINPITL